MVQGVGSNVHNAQILSNFGEDLLWPFGLLGYHNPSTLLNTVVFLLGKGCTLIAGKEHRSLRAAPFNSQFNFVKGKCC